MLPALTALAVSLYAAAFAIDYSVYYAVAKFLLPKGGPLYGAAGLPWPMWYRYPPLFLFFVFPLTLLPFRVGAFVWTLGKCAVLYGLAGRVLRELPSSPNWVLVCALALPYLVLEFRYANAQFFVFALTVWALMRVERFPRRAAFVLGLATAIKVWPLFFVPYWAARGRVAAAFGAVASAALLTLLPALYFGWDVHLSLLSEWYSQEASIASEAGSIWFPSQSLLGVLTRYLTEIDYSSMPDSNYWNVNFASFGAGSVWVLWLAVGAAGYAMLMLVANRWHGSALRMDAIAFCALVLLQPFAQKQSSLVVLVLPALVAGCLPARTRKTRAGWVIATAAVISGMQPLFASGDWQRSFQLVGVDTLIVLLLLAGMALSMRSEALGLKWK